MEAQEILQDIVFVILYGVVMGLSVAAAERRAVTAQQLASESGYRSYSTFSAAFKQYTGKTVTSWMHGAVE